MTRQILCQLIRQDRTLIQDHRRLESWLRDLCPKGGPRMKAVLLAQREGFVAQLASSDGTVAVQIVLARVVKTFGEETGLREDIAQWAVNAWALALGLLASDSAIRTDGAIGAPSSPDGEPPSPEPSAAAPAPPPLPLPPLMQSASAVTAPLPSSPSTAEKMRWFFCPHCEHSGQVPTSSAGRIVECPSCGKSVRISADGLRFSPSVAMPSPPPSRAAPAPTQPRVEPTSSFAGVQSPEESKRLFLRELLANLLLPGTAINAFVRARIEDIEERYHLNAQELLEDPALSATARDTPLPSARLVVSPDGRNAALRTITEALRLAPPDAQILIRPGFYRENLVLDKPVILLGEGKLDHIIIEGTSSGGVVMKAPYARVNGLTLRRPLSATTSPAVLVPEGCLRVEDCNLSSVSTPCVLVRGEDSKCKFRWCRIFNGGAGGIVFEASSCGSAEDCSIFGHKTWGIDVRESADILIRRCHIHSCVVGGMLVHKLGCANIEESLICDNDGVGVEVNSNDFTLIRGCMINSNGCHGFHARNASAAIIEDCDLTDNTPEALQIDSSSNVQLLRNREV